jgi:hypothetical protein
LLGCFDALDPTQHLVSERRSLALDALEPPQVLHADQSGFGPPSRREHDPLPAVGCVVDE